MSASGKLPHPQGLQQAEIMPCACPCVCVERPEYIHFVPGAESALYPGGRQQPDPKGCDPDSAQRMGHLCKLFICAPQGRV